MNHGIICKNLESIQNLTPNPIFGEFNRIENYFKQLNGYRGTYVITIKTHLVRTLLMKGYARKRIQQALDLHHSSICYHLDRMLLDHEEYFIEKHFENCLLYSMVPVTNRNINGIPQYKLTPMSEFNKYNPKEPKVFLKLINSN